MAKRIFLIITILGIILFFLPTSAKIFITKYPRIAFLFPLEGMNNLIRTLQSQKKESQILSELATKLIIENAQLKEKTEKNQFSKILRTPHLIQVDIIARDNETGLRFLTIDKGTDNHVKENMTALNPQGIIGKIVESTKNQSIIETVLSPGLKISGIDERSRVVGVIDYYNLANLKFKYAFAESDIKTGDTIVTSGLGGVFPRGLSIGIVVNVNIDATRFFQFVEVKPTVDFNTLEDIFILPSEAMTYNDVNSENYKSIQTDTSQNTSQ